MEKSIAKIRIAINFSLMPNARGKLRRSEAEGTNRRSLLASA